MLTLDKTKLNGVSKTITTANEKREKIGKVLHKEFAYGEKGFHMLYLTAAVLEGNGFYSTCAGTLVVVMLASVIFNGDGEV